MRTSRLVVFIQLVSGIVTFFMMQAQLDENSRWAFVGVILLLAIIWVYLETLLRNRNQLLEPLSSSRLLPMFHQNHLWIFPKL